jgi:tyrosinase
MFGHHTIQAPVTFTLPLTAPLANRNNTLNFSVVQAPMAMRPGIAMSGPEKVEVLSIVVERH